MNTDKALLIKGIKFLGYTVGLMFLAPWVLFQAFKNQDHPFYIPVLIIGLLLAIAAIGMGFYSIKVVVEAVFGGRKN